MFKLSHLPNVNLSFLNLLLSEETNRFLETQINRLLEKIFSVDLEKLEIEVVRLSRNVTPYVFYVGHQQCALDLSLSYDQLYVNSLLQADSKVSRISPMESLIEEHMALQVVSCLKELIFKDEKVVFQGQVAEDSFSELDCISIKLTLSKDKEEQICRVNIFIPPKLELSEEAIKQIKNPPALDLLKSAPKSGKDIIINMFLGVLHLPPASLVDMLTPGNIINLPDDFSLEECIVSLNEVMCFSGALLKHESGNAFLFREKVQQNSLPNPSGFSTIFLRVYSGTIASEEVPINFPYFLLNSKWDGEIEMLIGGEFVSRGVLEYAESGLIVRVC